MERPPKVITYLLHFLFILYENVPTSFMNKRPLRCPSFHEKNGRWCLQEMEGSPSLYLFHQLIDLSQLHLALIKK